MNGDKKTLPPAPCLIDGDLYQEAKALAEVQRVDINIILNSLLRASLALSSKPKPDQPPKKKFVTGY